MHETLKILQQSLNFKLPNASGLKKVRILSQVTCLPTSQMNLLSKKLSSLLLKRFVGSQSKYENLLMNKIQSGIFQLKTDPPVPEVDMLPNVSASYYSIIIPVHS